ncbi:phosphatidylglycerophosphatase A family protein [Adhaeretor mobilis]|nr:phosphatidylglycerophosphatase A [Adhaeretor mobilis]
MTQTVSARFYDRFALWIATGIGVGLFAPAPGTLGSLWGLPLAILLGTLQQPISQLATIAALILVAVVIASRAAGVLGGSKDPQAIVIDEFAILPIAYFGVGPLDWKLLLTGWLLFRLFDITKPPPCKKAEQLPGGWGIVADDVVAAIYACLALHVFIWLDAALSLDWLNS